MLSALAFIGALVLFHLRSSTEKVDHTYLQAKEALSTLFIHTVFDEARRLLRLVDDHLPAALAQASTKNPQISRFDYFCGALRKIGEEELDERGGKYFEIIRDSFSRIVSNQIDRLLQAAQEPDSPLPEDLINPSGIHYQLEGATDLTFQFISVFSARCHRRKRRTRIARIVGLIAFIVVFICVAASLFFLFFDAAWAETSMSYCLFAGTVAFVIGIISTLTLEVNQHLLSELATAFQSKKGIDAKLDAWKNRHA